MNTDVENSGIQLQEMLELQLAEVEMLQSMFPNPGEFTLDSKTVLEELQSYVDGRIRYEYLGTRIGFTVKILTSSTPENPLELVCNFPHEYPSILPEVFTRAPAMDRESHRHLSEDLHEFISSVETGQIIVGSVIEWLQENAHRYLKEDLDLKNSSSRQISNKEETSFTRLWIYSHHIYSKFKRRDIVDWATELGLNGFSMPGKPGIICVEGATEGVDEFWYRIRRLNWKRIMIKEQERMGPGSSVGSTGLVSRRSQVRIWAGTDKGQLYVQTQRQKPCPTPVSMSPQWHIKDLGHSAISAGGQIHLNTQTPG